MRQDYGSLIAFADKAVETYFRHAPRRLLTDSERRDCRIVAHRGRCDPDADVIDNTLEAFDRARELRLWGIELDIQWTRDDVPVVIHDSHTAHLPGQIGLEIGQTSFDELRRLCPVVPAFEEIVQRYGTDLHYMVDLKSETISAAGMKNLAACLSNIEPAKDYHLLSTDADALSQAAAFPKECRLLVATTDTKRKFRQALRLELGGLTGHYLLLNFRMRRELAARNLKWGTGFVSSGRLLAREARAGAEWIFSEAAAKLLQE